MNISQIFSSQSNKAELPRLNPSLTHHARILESTNFDLNLVKEHEKMILIGARLYRLENPNNFKISEEVTVRVIPSSDGKTHLAISGKALPPRQYPTIIDNLFPPKEFWNKSSRLKNLSTAIIRELISNINVDAWSLLLKGILPSDNKTIDMQMTKLLENWVLKSQENNTADFHSRFFQLPFELDDRFEVVDFTYYKSKAGKNTHKLIIRIGQDADEAVCSILLSNELLFVNFFSEGRITPKMEEILRTDILHSVPQAEVNFYNNKFINNSNKNKGPGLSEYG